MDFLIQKAVELGINHIVPIETERSVVRLTTDKARKRQTHWQKIAISACEQSARSIIPKVDPPIALADFLITQPDQGFVLHHRAEQTLLKMPKVDRATVLIGPEGGLSEGEISQAMDAGYQALQLGKRVLRTETASLVAIANMQLLWGEL